MRRLAASIVCARRTERTTTLLCTPPLRPRCAELTAAGRKLIVYSVTNGCDRGAATLSAKSHRIAAAAGFFSPFGRLFYWTVFQ